MSDRFEGIYPAVVTPFSGDSVNLEAFTALVDRLYKAGVDGVYVGGNTGEWYLQTVEERRRVIRAAVELSRGRGRVIAHVGCAATADAIALAREAERAGADAVSSLPPYISKWGAAEISNYYRRLSSATALPCFVYYFPALTGSNCGPSFFEAMRALPNIRGFKFTDMNLYELGLMAERATEGFTILNGHDQVLLPALTMGAHGGIGSFYNVLPEAFVRLYRAWKAGDVGCARAKQTEINRVIEIVKRRPLIPSLRFLLRAQGLDCGPSREPTLPLTAQEEAALETELCGSIYC
ncbi:MAG: dihydrodipicolinate synthase family protein [Bryobacteraceae bacterium]